MAKIKYSQTLVEPRRIYNKHYAKLNLDSDLLYQKMKSDLYKLPNKDDLTFGFEMWFKDFQKELTHLFLVDRHLKYTLRDMNLTDLKGIKDILRSKGVEKNAFIAKVDLETKVVTFDFSLHIPFEKFGYIFSLVLHEDSEMVLQFDDGDKTGAIPEEHYRILKNSDDKTELYLASLFRLATNLVAYVECFPEQVKDGVPHNVPSLSHDKSFHVETVDKLNFQVNKSNKINAPHIRKAHFRRLTSDYFKNKKGKIILVQETMVNGKAKSVYTAKDLTKMM
jgi:hypothetical protein